MSRRATTTADDSDDIPSCRTRMRKIDRIEIECLVHNPSPFKKAAKWTIYGRDWPLLAPVWQLYYPSD